MADSSNEEGDGLGPSVGSTGTGASVATLEAAAAAPDAADAAADHIVSRMLSESKE